MKKFFMVARMGLITKSLSDKNLSHDVALGQIGGAGSRGATALA